CTVVHGRVALSLWSVPDGLCEFGQPLVDVCVIPEHGTLRNVLSLTRLDVRECRQQSLRSVRDVLTNVGVVATASGRNHQTTNGADIHAWHAPVLARRCLDSHSVGVVEVEVIAATRCNYCVGLRQLDAVLSEKGIPVGDAVYTMLHVEIDNDDPALPG